MRLIAAILAALIFAGGIASAQDEISPVNAPEVQTKTVHIMTAEERSTILISDIWKPPELERVKMGKGSVLGAIREAKAPIEPYGWQAFVGQDCRGSWRGSYEAAAYGAL